MLARVPDFLDVVEVLFDRRTIRERFHDLARGRVGIGAEEVLAAVLFLDDRDRVTFTSWPACVQAQTLVAMSRCKTMWSENNGWSSGLVVASPAGTPEPNPKLKSPAATRTAAMTSDMNPVIDRLFIV